MVSEDSLKERAYSIIAKETIINEINTAGKKYLVTYNYQSDKSLSEMLKKGNQRIMDSTKKYYQFLRKRAIELKIDVSMHPEKLEELTN